MPEPAAEFWRIRSIVLSLLKTREPVYPPELFDALKARGISREWGATVTWEMCARGDLKREPITWRVSLPPDAA